MSTVLEGPSAIVSGSPSAPVKTRETATVVIPTFNVAPIIARCLDALTWVDAVHIVDMFSTDETQAICRRYPNVRVFERKDYIYANVNYGMEQATTDWVIRLDSDEIINADLAAGIVRVLENPEPGVSGYIFPSVQYMFGLPTKWGVGKPEYNTRKCMFRRGTAHYECKHEHEDIISTGVLKPLGGFYEHFTNHDTAEIVRKYCYYARKDVERMGDAELAPLPPLKVWYRAVRFFILFYFQWQGYKDGMLGFYSSLFRGPVNTFILEASRWEEAQRRQKSRQEKESAPPALNNGSGPPAPQ